VFQKYRRPDPKTLNWRAACNNLDPIRGELCAMQPFSDFGTEEEAIAAWNSRPPQPDTK
jgi:hypothetical protein